MKLRIHYIKSSTPVWELSHDMAVAAFEFNTTWLFEIKEACQILSESEGALKSAFQALNMASTELHAIAERRAKLLMKV